MVNLQELVEELKQQADHFYGMECLVGFLVAQLRSQPGWNPEQLLQSLFEEQREQLERDCEVPRLLPFERLDAYLRSLAGYPVETAYLPIECRQGFPRLSLKAGHLRSVPPEK